MNDFKRFLDIALKSTYETMTALEIAERLRYCSHKQLEPLLDETDHVAAMIVRLKKRLQEGPDFKSIHESDTEYSTDFQP